MKFDDGATIRINSSIGNICITEVRGEIVKIGIVSPSFKIAAPQEPVTELLCKAADQLQQYFNGTRRSFDFKLGIYGTAFETKVYEALLNIPYGETSSYKLIAAAVGSPKAARAVGAACHKNPLCIVVPCHRVVATNGALTGYALGLDKKRFLLKLENASMLELQR